MPAFKVGFQKPLRARGFILKRLISVSLTTMNRLALFLLFSLPFFAQAQVKVTPLQISVTENGNNLKLAWAGGLQAPQFSRLDLNNDGILDLVVFDRYDYQLLPFLNSGQVSDTAYTFAPHYASFFPQDLHEWVLIEDYNCDGKPDLFTAGQFDEVRVFKNVSTGSQIAFQMVKSRLQATNAQIAIPSADIPALSDIDNDGDLDLVAFTSGSDFVSYFKNMRVENGQTCAADTLHFVRETSCWGRFKEDFFSSSIALNVTCGSIRQANPNAKTNLHAGSTLLVLDADNDGDKDAVIGDISGSNLTFLQNGGTTALANMTAQNTSWPPVNPLNLYVFPASFYLDVNNDGIKDLVVAPNNGGDGGSKNFEQVHYYRNLGTNNNPNFSFQKNDFLNGEMIEVGASAAPAFTDYDRDGDLDLLIGNDNYTITALNAKAQLALYQNVGTSAAPRYNLVTRDYLTLSNRNLTSITPTFGDLDGDGDADLLFGESQGFVFYFRNDALAGQPANYVFVSSNYLNQSVGANSAPHLTDIDRDGDLDLIVGERNGTLNFFRNNGSVSAANFSLITTTLGNVTVRNPNVGAGYAAPAVADLNQNNLYDLLVGDLDGKVHYYPDIENNLTGTFTQTIIGLQNSLTNQTDTLQAGRRAFPVVANLNADNRPDVMVGLGRGGLQVFQNAGLINGIAKAPKSAETLTVFPNPFTENFTLNFKAGTEATVEISDLLGRECFKTSVPAGASSAVLNLGNLKSGMYLLTFCRGTGEKSQRKILKINQPE